MNGRPSCWVLRECGAAACATKVFASRAAAEGALAWYRSLEALVGPSVVVPVEGLVKEGAGQGARGDEARLAAACGLPVPAPGDTLSGVTFRDASVIAPGVSFQHGLLVGPRGAGTTFVPTLTLVLRVGQVLLNNVARLHAAGAPHLYLTPFHVTASGLVLDVEPNPEARLAALEVAVAQEDTRACWEPQRLHTVPVDLWVGRLFEDTVRGPQWAAQGLPLPAVRADAGAWRKAVQALYSALGKELSRDHHRAFWMQVAAVGDPSNPLTITGLAVAANRGDAEGLTRDLIRTDRSFLQGRGFADGFQQDVVMMLTACTPAGYVTMLQELAAGPPGDDGAECKLQTMDLRSATVGPAGFAHSCTGCLNPLSLADVGAQGVLLMDPALSAMATLVGEPVCAMGQAAALQTLWIMGTFQPSGTSGAVPRLRLRTRCLVRCWPACVKSMTCTGPCYSL